MLARELRRLLPILGPAVILIFIIAKLYDNSVVLLPSIKGLSSKDSSTELQESETSPNHVGHPIAGYTKGAYREIFSVSTSDKKYFKIEFQPHRGINPNAVPHPTLENTWILVAQRDDNSIKNSVWFAELYCNAVFKDGALSCIDPPFILPIGRTLVSIKYQDNKNKTDII